MKNRGQEHAESGKATWMVRPQRQESTTSRLYSWTSESVEINSRRLQP
jgi:hypothetical protein